MQGAIYNVEIGLYDIIEKHRYVNEEPEYTPGVDEYVVFLRQYFVEEDGHNGGRYQACNHDLPVDALPERRG
jgi:hypothetical protein